MQRLAESEPEAHCKTTHQASKLQTRRFEDGLIEIAVIPTEKFSLLLHKT